MVRGAKISCTFSPTTSSTAGDGPYVVGVKCGRAAALVTTNPSILHRCPTQGIQLCHRMEIPFRLHKRLVLNN